MYRRIAVPQLRANVLALPFGLTGLGLCWSWLAPATLHRATAAVWLLAAVSWVVSSSGYLWSVRRTRRLAAELSDATFSPFVALLFLPLMPLGAYWATYAPGPGRILVVGAAAAVTALGSWLSAGWLLGGTGLAMIHPGYLLPTVAAGLLAAGSLSTVGDPGAALVMFGLGLVCWAFLGSIIFVRLVAHPLLPVGLRPTLAILVAPPAVAGNAWLTINDDRVDAIALGLAGFGLLMALTQLRFIPIFATVPFGPGWWSFAFSYLAVVGFATRLAVLAGFTYPATLTTVVLAVATAAVTALLTATTISVVRGTYFPITPPAPHRKGTTMDDSSILHTVSELVEQEHHLRDRLTSEPALARDEDRERLRHLEESLDQCWDLLRQRRALEAVGSDPETAQARPVQQVENYTSTPASPLGRA